MYQNPKYLGEGEIDMGNSHLHENRTTHVLPCGKLLYEKPSPIRQ